MSAQGQHVVITGTTKGLGNCLCHQLLAQGYSVTGFARSAMPEGWQRHVSDNHYHHMIANLADLNNVDLVFSEILKRGTGYVILNAADYSMPANMQSAKLLEQVNLNLLFPVLLIQKIISKKLNKPLTIIFISSIMAEFYDSKNPMYGAAKTAVHHFINGLQLQDFPQITFLKIIAGPMHNETTQCSWLKQITSQKYTEVATKIILHLNNDKTEVYVPGLWRCIVFIARLAGKKPLSYLLKSYR